MVWCGVAVADSKNEMCIICMSVFIRGLFLYVENVNPSEEFHHEIVYVIQT